jgi:hypothetical protein
MSLTQKTGITGVLSNWDEYSTKKASEHNESQTTQYTVPEILNEIRKIKKSFDPQILERMMLLLEDHIHNSNNPHKTTIDSMGTSVIAELYKEWTNLGYTGSIDTFIKILFQYIEIADIETTRAGVSSSKLVSVKGAKRIYDEHLEDPNAHNEMFRDMLPGIVPNTYPTWSIQSIVGVDSEISVERPAPCMYHKPDGYLDTVPAHTLPIDYCYGEPFFSIWGKRKNLITHSTTLESGSFFGGYKTISDKIESPNHEMVVSKYHEDVTNITKEHGWSTPTIPFEIGKVYTASIYVYPKDRSYFTTRIPDGLSGETARLHINLNNIDERYIPIHYDDTINSVEVIKFPNGWFRIIHTFKAQKTIDTTIDFLFLDILDGDTTYIGDGCTSGYLWQGQVECGVNASPPILTEDLLVERPATIVKVPFRDKFSLKNGTFVIEAKKPKDIKRNATQYLYALGDDTTAIMSGKFPITRNQELYIESINTFDEILDYAWLGPNVAETNTFSYGYNHKYHIYADTDNPIIRNTVEDTSITYSEAMRYLLTDKYEELLYGNDKCAIFDFQNVLKESNTSVSGGSTIDPDSGIIYIGNSLNFVDLNPTDNIDINAQLCDFVLSSVLERSIETYDGIQSVGTIDLVKGIDSLGTNTTINNRDQIFIGNSEEYEDMDITDDPSTNIELADYILSTVYPKAKSFYSGKQIATIDLVQGLETIDTTTLPDICDTLFIGSNIYGTEQLDGYIKSITYYSNYSDELTSEFFVGEYIHE